MHLFLYSNVFRYLFVYVRMYVVEISQEYIWSETCIHVHIYIYIYIQLGLHRIIFYDHIDKKLSPSAIGFMSMLS